MIDKITPRPAEVVEKALEADGIEDMAPIITSRNTYIAPFVNAEVPQYLVVEDRFPNGRPALEKAGVYMTDRDTVNMTERMKVTTCLNPLHTALAVYGCVLGYDSIAAEMKDADLKKLVETIGYKEGMPDTSQKITVRFGETIKSYVASDSLDIHSLTAIPLAIAGWLRYLLAVDDEGKEMNVSSDPMLEVLQKQLADVKLGNPESADGKLTEILSNKVLFGSDLNEIGLAEKIEGMFKELIAGPGAVRATLHKYMA